MSPRALFQVLDRTLLLWRVRIAEPSFCVDPLLQFAPIAELDTSVKGDRAACWLGQGLQTGHELVDEVRRAAVVVAKQDGEASLAFDQRRWPGRSQTRWGPTFASKR